MKGRTTTRSSHQPCVHTVTPVVCRRRQSAPFLFALLTPPLGDATTFYMILLRPRRGDTLARKWRGLSDCLLFLSLLSLSLPCPVTPGLAFQAGQASCFNSLAPCSRPPSTSIPVAVRRSIYTTSSDSTKPRCFRGSARVLQNLQV